MRTEDLRSNNINSSQIDIYKPDSYKSPYHDHGVSDTSPIPGYQQVSQVSSISDMSQKYPDLVSKGASEAQARLEDARNKEREAQKHE